MLLWHDVGTNGKKSSLHFGNSGCRLLFIVD